MTLDEAIAHAEQVADDHDRIKKIKAVTEYECKCAAEHRQLAKWLRELKAYRQMYREQNANNHLRGSSGAKEALEALSRLFNNCEEIDLHLAKDDPDRTGYNMADDVNYLRGYIMQTMTL